MAKLFSLSVILYSKLCTFKPQMPFPSHNIKIWKAPSSPKKFKEHYDVHDSDFSTQAKKVHLTLFLFIHLIIRKVIKKKLREMENKSRGPMVPSEI